MSSATRWCIRWLSLPKTDRSFGGLLPEAWETRAKATEERRRLQRAQPLCISSTGRFQRVRYIVFARPPDDSPRPLILAE